MGQKKTGIMKRGEMGRGFFLFFGDGMAMGEDSGGFDEKKKQETAR